MEGIIMVKLNGENIKTSGSRDQEDGNLVSSPLEVVFALKFLFSFNT